MSSVDIALLCMLILDVIFIVIAWIVRGKDLVL